MSALDEYIDAWLAADVDRIAAAVAPQCVIIESYGPVYRGRDTVRRWARDWFAAGGLVHRWEIAEQFSAGQRHAAQWTFECTWNGERFAFDGATVARLAGSLIVELREYQTAGRLYDWHGQWR